MQERRFFDGEKVKWGDSDTLKTGVIIDGYFDMKSHKWFYLVKDEIGTCTKVSEEKLVRRYK